MNIMACMKILFGAHQNRIVGSGSWCEVALSPDQHRDFNAEMESLILLVTNLHVWVQGLTVQIRIFSTSVQDQPPWADHYTLIWTFFETFDRL